MTVVKRKYIDPIPIDEWMCRPDKNPLHASAIWKATLDSSLAHWKWGEPQNRHRPVGGVQ